MKTFPVLGALMMAFGVAAGAFGAHALADRLEPRALEIFDTAVRYLAVHALALLVLPLLAERSSRPAWVRLAGWLLVCGVIVFSGSLLLLALSGLRWLGAITPLGGLCFIAGWIALAGAMLAPASRPS